MALLDPEVLARLGPLGLRTRTAVEGLLSGQHRCLLKGRSLEFTEHRPYSFGDDLRRLDWRVFGRTDRLTVREYEAETNLRLWLLLDDSASMAYGGKYEYAASLAAALAYLAIDQGDAVGLVLLGGPEKEEKEQKQQKQQKEIRVIPPRPSASHLPVILSAMEKAGMGREGNGKTGTNWAEDLTRLGPSLGRRALLVLVSDLLGDPDPVLACLKGLAGRRHEVWVCQVLHPDELEFPFSGETLFLDPETSRGVQADPAAVRASYRQAMAALRKRYEEGCRRSSVAYRMFRTDEPLASGLLQLLTA